MPYVLYLKFLKFEFSSGFIGEWLEAFKYSFFLRLKLWLNVLLLQKSLKIQVLSRSLSQQPNFINILTQDVQRLENGLRSLIDTFGIVFELIFGVYYLSTQISQLNFSFKGLFWLVSILMLSNILIVAISQIFGLRGNWARDRRVAVLQEVFQGIRAIKTLSWEAIFEGKILKTRQEEFSNIRMIRIIDAFFNSLIRSIGFIIMLVLSVWLEGSELKVDLYSALVLINQLVYPITAFPWSIGSAVGSVFPYLRLQSHFKAREVTHLAWKEKGDKVLEIRGLEYYWGESGEKGIRVREFNAEKGELIMIYGENGSGKTTLLRLILGEIEQKSGSITVDKDNIAYVSQDTWLIDGSFQENIILNEAFNEEKYRSCLNCCALLKETEGKEKGFNLGLNGNKLSGGQRQRVSLCRALYQEKELYFLDDVFSSLDEQVADEIFKEYVLKGLVNRGKTVLFITSQEKYIKWAHRVFELKAGELVGFDVKRCGELMIERKPSRNDNKEMKIIENSENIDVTNQKKLEYFQPFAWGGIQRYLQALGTKTFVFILLISLIQQAAKHYSEIFFNNLLTTPSPGGNNLPLALIYMVLTILRGLFYCFGVLKVSQAMFRELIKFMLNANMSFFEEYQPGDLINYLTRDIDSIDCGLPEDVNGWASTLINIIGIFAVISYEFPVLIALCWLIGYRAFKYYRDYSRNNKIQNQDMKMIEAKLLNEILELSQGIITIRAFKKQGFFLEKATKTLKDYLLQCVRSFSSHRAVVFRCAILTLSSSTSIWLFSLLYFSWEGRPYDPKVLGVALSYSLLLSRHLLDAICGTVNLESQLISLQRLVSLELASKTPLKYDSKEDTAVQTCEIENKEELISFKEVFMRYGEGNNRYSLEGINLSIKKGEKVAFCGRTGSGKSSIFSLILKLYPYQSGSICYQGKPLPEIELKELRKSIAMIPQNGFLFKGTLKENFDPEGRFTPLELQNFLKEYELEEVFIGKSLDFIVEREGANLSNGEKQLVNFLQNVLADKPVVLLDEATSNLDEKLDRKIMGLLRRICKEKSLLLISHRLENLEFFDRVYVLKEGRIWETGNFKELNGNPGSLFNSLKAKQNYEVK